MPEHEMPFSGKADMQAFNALDGFTQGYVHGMFFTECHGGNPELEDKTFADIAPETLERIVKECAEFQAFAKSNLDAAYEVHEYEEERAGTDFWFTRNHHGAGYWDRGMGGIGDLLTTAAHTWSSVDLYAGDDGKLYLA